MQTDKKKSLPIQMPISYPNNTFLQEKKKKKNTTPLKYSHPHNYHFLYQLTKFHIPITYSYIKKNYEILLR